MAMTYVKRGRKIGSTGRFKCCICGVIEIAKGGATYFRCVSCKESKKYPPDHFDRVRHGGAAARSLVKIAVHDGALKQPSNFACTDCGTKAVEYDHRDYNDPLSVDPVCHSCNKKRGPAIPLRGYLAWAFQNQFPPYMTRKDMIRICSFFGIEIDPLSVPGKPSIEHWMPYRDLLLAAENSQGLR